MLSTERLIAIAALALASLALLTNHGATRSVTATQDAPPDRIEADEVVLSGREPLVLSNRDERLSWGNRPTERVWSFGAVHIDRVIKALMQSDAYLGEREELEQELIEMEQEFSARGEALQEEYADISEEDPDFPEAQQRMQAMMQEYQQFAQVAQGRMGQLQTIQLERGYREMVEAVEVISDEKSIDMVVRFIPTAEPFGTNVVEQAMLQIRLRTLLRYPDAIDITEDVLEELDLEG